MVVPHGAHAHVLHVVRHPMDVISSFVAGLDYFREWVPPDPWHRFIYTHVPELRLDYDPLERAALYYVRWNRMVEERSRGKRYTFCRLEDGPRELLPRLGVRCKDQAQFNPAQFAVHPQHVDESSVESK